ncbi:nicotinate phosphoribosyltransferase [Litorimonas sp.]|jgi:hypothetical protein|uniref:nicotinate phosphoribosyltransferase n=1 Tax=Alphaproteobacteria TaxID=28211 RepID=UPI000C0EBFCF|nr:nicotinate phosphoribosyltransferase [Roseobacter sp.]MBV49495.1 nicotinate phosphoribosyltransferase [Roseobacter sp.]PHR07735.1 MAG: nicotinate phosphoribosyltransferase [Sulfitobacter sp.]|tara:strand:- start:803 stop:1444 length:642 start_codon:yes stop_codon:yes gene_type:complete
MKLTSKTLIATLLATGMSTAAIAQTSTGTGAGASVGTSNGASADVNASGSASTNATKDLTKDAKEMSKDMTDMAKDKTDMAKDKAKMVKDKAKEGADKTSKMAKENYGQLISDLRSNTSANAEVETNIKNFKADAKVDTVLVSDLKKNAGNEAKSLDNALEAQKDSVTKMRSAIDANPDLKSKVEDEGYTVDDIVAVRSGTNGELTLVVDDRK